MKKLYLLLLVVLLACNKKEQTAYKFFWLNPSKPIQERVDSLRSRLTLEEKISLLMYFNPAIARLDIQEFKWGGEALHGLAYMGRATVFPQAIGLAATFDENLEYRIASAISDEAHAKAKAIKELNPEEGTFGLAFFSPNINIFRDPRWGRGQETYGEDPYLTSRMGVAFVKGMQGDNPVYLKTIACAKHFVCHSGPENDRCMNNPKPTMQELMETYVPAFKALSEEANVSEVMVTYNFLNDTPLCASKTIINLLKTQVHFKNLIMTDGGALNNMHGLQKFTKDEVQTAAASMNAGIHFELGGIYKNLKKAVEMNLVKESQIDSAVIKVLTLRFRLGEFDPPQLNPYNKIGIDSLHTASHIKLAREAAAKSVVLLKNNNVLPLKKNLKRLYVIGPTATNGDVLLGNYNGFSDNMSTLLEGVMGKIDPGTVMTYRPGCRLDEPNLTKGDWADVSHQSDAIIMFFGLTAPSHEGEEGEPINSFSNGDRLDLNLLKNQVDYLKKQRGYGKKPIILVLSGGSPIISPEIYDLADAVLFIWYPGEEGGNGVADVIFGDVIPSGRLPITFPKTMSQLPDFKNYSMKNRTYRYMQEEPLFPFGFGLSYTTFAYSDIKATKTSFDGNDSASVSVTLTNSGKYDADEVMQMYVSYQDELSNKPLFSLKKIKKVHLKAGKSTEVAFNIGKNELSLADADGKVQVLKGLYKIYIGGSSPVAKSVTLGAAKQEMIKITIN